MSILRWSIYKCERSRPADRAGALVDQADFSSPRSPSQIACPIANVIVANHVVTEKGRDSRERVPKCCAANVTYVHRLGHIGRPEIDHDFLWRCRPCDP